MSGRGGRGGGGARAVADALGIQRQDIAAYTTVLQSAEPLPLFPPVSRRPVPFTESDPQLEYLANANRALIKRIRESPFFLEQPTCDDDIRRYTDKYRISKKETWQPDWRRLPAELCWVRKKKTAGQASSSGKSSTGERPKKRQRTLADKAKIDNKFARLEDEEKTGKYSGGEESIIGSSGEIGEGINREKEDGQEEEEEEEGTEEVFEDVEQAEEANDYMENYFDPGDDYLNSDDNLEDDNYS